MITTLNVFETTFEFFTAPFAVIFRMNQLIRRWGASLDATAPVAVRVEAMRAMRRFGTAGTPF